MRNTGVVMEEIRLVDIPKTDSTKLKQLYEKRKAHIIYLRNEKHWTLAKIAQLYNISRQRVYQILTDLKGNDK